MMVVMVMMMVTVTVMVTVMVMVMVAIAVVAAATAVVVVATAVVVVATAVVVVIVPPVHGAGKTAAMAPAITLGRAMPTTKVAAVVAVDRPVAVAMTIPVTAELRADLSR